MILLFIEQFDFEISNSMHDEVNLLAIRLVMCYVIIICSLRNKYCELHLSCSYRLAFDGKAVFVIRICFFCANTTEQDIFLTVLNPFLKCLDLNFYFYVQDSVTTMFPVTIFSCPLKGILWLCEH